MGSGRSSAGSGGSLSGGKTILTGTFIAEQTHTAKHGGPASYELWGLGSAKGRRGGHRVQAAFAGRGDRLRKSQKGGTQCTKLSALEEIDSLLLPNEDDPVLLPKAPLVPSSPKVKAGPARGRATTAAADYAENSASADALAVPQAISAVEPVRPDKLPSGQSNEDEDCGPLVKGEEEASGDKQHATALAALSLQPTPPAADRLVALKPSPRKVQTRGGRKVPLQQRGPLVAPAVLTDIFGEADLQAIPSNASITGMASPSDACSSSLPVRAGQCSSRPASQPARSPNDVSKVVGRLYIVPKPWVAGRTDSQLLQYLAWRGGTPEIASPPRSAPPTSTISDSVGSTFSGPSFLSSTSRSHRRQYRSHRELFDNCLRRDRSPSPPPRDDSCFSPIDEIENRSSRSGGSRSGSRPIYTPSQLAKGQVARQQSAKLIDQIEDIAVIPLDAVHSFLEAEMISASSSRVASSKIEKRSAPFGRKRVDIR